MSDSISRRDFFKLAGLGAAAAAALTGCGPAARYVVRRPYTDMPEYNQTGLSTYYATTCRECAAGCGLIVRTKEGRAIKTEGNPAHPVNSGKLCSRGLTAVQGLYNPDRLYGPRRRTARGADETVDLGWEEAAGVVGDALAGAPPDQIAFLLGLAPDHLFDLAAELMAALGAPAPLRYGALGMFEGRATLLKAIEQVFGKSALPFFDLSASDVVFSFGANFLETWLSPVAYSRAYGHLRQGTPGRRGYLVVFEPRQSLTAGNADEWIPITPGSEGLVAQALGRLVAELRGGKTAQLDAVEVTAAAAASGVAPETLERLARLFAEAARPLAIPGGGALGHRQGLAAAQSILRLNQLAGNLGQPGGVFLAAEQTGASSLADLQGLVERMNAGQVKVLLIHGVNPLFELPAALGFGAALAKVPLVISFATFPDETALQSDVILPDHSPLESWGYQRTLAGSDRQALSASQPVVSALYDTRSTADVLLAAVRGIGGALAVKIPYSDEVDFLQKKLLPLLDRRDGLFSAPEILTFWSRWLQQGGWWQSQAGLEPPPAGERLPFTTPAIELQPPGEDEFYLVTYATQLGDGSGANRPWLQETPDPMTTVIWNSWVEIHPQTAARLGLQDDDVVEISSPAGRVEAVVYRYPAIRPDVVAIPFGQGHTALGRYAENRGCNPANLLAVVLNEAGDLAFGDTRARIVKTGRRRPLARFESRHGVYGDGEK